MTDPGWLLVVEQGELWTAAVQTELRRAADARPPLVRRRQAPPALPELDPRAALFVALELRPDNLHSSLEWINGFRRLPGAGCAALLSLGAGASRDDRRELELAALEAGACLAVSSPRLLGPLPATVRRSLEQARHAAGHQLPPHERVWRRLPWQPEPWPVG